VIGPRTLLRRAWAVAGVALLLVVVSDQLLRVALKRLSDADAPAMGIETTDREEADAYAGQDWAGDYWSEFHASKDMTWHAYVSFRRLPYAGRYIHVDERGLRRTWAPEGGGERPLVYVFGGSALWGTGARDEHTIPSQLARRLAAAGLPCDVVNYGESGWVSTQEAFMLARELQAGRVPDAAVFFDGFNDLFAARSNGVAGLPQNEPRRELEFNLSRDGSRLWALALGDTLKGWSGLIRRLRPRAHRPQVDLETLARAAVRAWHGALRTARALGREHGFETLFYRQPVLATRTAPTDYERSALGATSAEDREAERVFAACVAADADLAALPGFHDLGALLDDRPGPQFVDFVHLSESAAAVVADRITADLLPLLRARR
jgi:lysophospholipase L1-like esterase